MAAPIPPPAPPAMTVAACLTARVTALGVRHGVTSDGSDIIMCAYKHAQGR
jgi:hypothetical protein